MPGPTSQEPDACSRCGGILKFVIELRQNSEPGLEYRVYKCEACERIECHPAKPG